MTRLCVLTFGLFLGLTQTVFAVSINEVAWMGGTSNSNHEWIELYNPTDETVSLAGWSLIDGVNLNILLSGNIGSQSYAVLERTSDDTVDGTALLIYSGALVNTGATLILRDASSGVVDQVTGGTDWQNIGGDNATKETAQYTATGWVTDTPTPGVVNRSGRVVPEETVTATTTATTTVAAVVTSSGNNSNRSGSNRSSSASVRIRNLETKMTLTPDVQTVAYVNQSIPLTVDVGGAYQNQDSMVRFVWNFGDMYTAEGKRVTHSYSYPGEYVVTVHAKNGKTEQVARHEIKVLPVQFSISRSEGGDLQIHNNALYDTDISGYVVKGSETVTFPPRTIILPRATITIPKHLVGEGSLVSLYDTKKELITSTYQSFVSLEKDYEVVKSAPAIVETSTQIPSLVSFGFETPSASAATPKEVIVIPATGAAAVASAPDAKSSRTLYLGLISIFGLIFLTVLFAGRRKSLIGI